MKLKHTLYRQLFAIIIMIFAIIAIFLGVLLPQALIPIYEKNIYQYLKQPLELINNDIGENEITDDVAYLYVIDDDITISSNFSEVIKLSPSKVINKVVSTYGKFTYLGTTYYYYNSYTEYGYKLSITSSKYIEQIRQDIYFTIFPTLAFTLAIISCIVILWIRSLVARIEHLKVKIDNLGNDDYKDNYHYKTDDELKVLSDAIDDMKTTLKEQDEYKNQMYQNISHDFKTPLTVIKSYIEALDDKMVSQDEAMNVIKEQTDKLELKVHSLLYLNKLNYIKDLNPKNPEYVDIAPILESSIKKFKYLNSNIKWELIINDKKTTYRGTYDMWETIIDNLFNNFIRYADKSIKVTIKNGKIMFYNDGPNIDEKILNDIFTPYKKGIKGQFGLGLSIVKKTIKLFNYEIVVKNEKKGVTFMIK